MARRGSLEEFEVARELSRRTGQTISLELRTAADGQRSVVYVDEAGQDA
jgi:hypothetical protein